MQRCGSLEGMETLGRDPPADYCCMVCKMAQNVRWSGDQFALA
jgi:hypothetical protein